MCGEEFIYCGISFIGFFICCLSCFGCIFFLLSFLSLHNSCMACAAVCMTLKSIETYLLNDRCCPPDSLLFLLMVRLHRPVFFSFTFALCYFRLQVTSRSPVRLHILCSGQSSVIMRWHTVPCLCFRASTTYRLPSLEGEQIEQQTTSLHQNLWRQRWAEGRFFLSLVPTWSTFSVSHFHRSQSKTDC